MNSKDKSFDIEIIADALNKASKCNINFYSYRLPDCDKGIFGASDTISDDLYQNGFIIAPFAKGQGCKSIIIPNHYGLEFPFENETFANNIITEEYVTAYDEYIKQANEIIDYLKVNGGKIVLSRIISIKKKIDIGNMFQLLAKQYPNAFVFCFSTTETGIWIGASPELLLKKDDSSLSTMSLAGTKRADIKTEWDTKCIEEQQIVTDYIAETFKSEGLYPTVSKPYNRKAGPVEHICTDISSNIDSNIDILKIVDRLSPTPALSGFPKNIAINKICTIEKHKRKYYGGYIGPSYNQNLTLYVNLRSMKYDGNNCYIYVGGGLTNKSNAEDEWNETLIKSKTLINVIEKC